MGMSFHATDLYSVYAKSSSSSLGEGVVPFLERTQVGIALGAFYNLV